MPQVSVIIPTHNRLELLRCAVESVRSQVYEDWELIIVDDGSKDSVCGIVESFNDGRIRCIRNVVSRGGSAARNTGIRAATGTYVAFLDDDDRWEPKKLAVQVPALMATESEVGFSFTATRKEADSGFFVTTIPEGVDDFHERALEYFSGFMTPTLLVKRSVFSEVGLFDEGLPSHQETDLMIRMTAKFKGLGINEPLTVVNLKSDHEHVGSGLYRRIAGRQRLLTKHATEFAGYSRFLAFHLFRLGLFQREMSRYAEAGANFFKAFQLSWHPRYLLHALSMLGGGFLYRVFKRLS